MARVVWSDRTADDLDGIIDYLRQFDPLAATRIGARIFTLGESLADFPKRGRPTPDGARELVTVAPYVLRYRVKDDVAVIVRIRHGRRRPLAG